jgi:hypothetical protein
VTILSEPPHVAAPVAEPVPPLPPSGRARRVLGGVLRWSVALLTIAVLGRLMSPVEAHASASRATSTYGGPARSAYYQLKPAG